MSKLNGRNFLVYILSLAVLLGGVGVMKGGLFVDQHEGDMLHLIDIVLRMSAGQVPHIDFMTPLGSLAFLPFSILVERGMGVGSALVWGQIAFAALVLPMLWWVCVSRLNTAQAYILATATVVTSLALIYGNTDPYVSMSMHYNRWAWALAFVVVPIAVFRPTLQFSIADGLILGLAMSFFAFGKITYAVALAPGLILALAITRQWRAMTIGIAVFLAIAAAMTLSSGIELWTSYIADLRLVSSTDIRPRAGESWMSLLFSPKFILAHAVLVGTIVLLRQHEKEELGAMLAIFAPGFVFIAYQNYGNDPKWLVLIAVIALAGSIDPKRLAVAIVALVLIGPSIVNMAFSPVRHALAQEARFTPALVPDQHADFQTLTVRDRRIQVGQPVIFESSEFAALNDLAEWPDFAAIGDTDFPPCLLQLGLMTSMRAIAADLAEQGVAVDKVFTADTFGSFWMFTEGAPLAQSAPWYYGQLSGFEQADFVLVPICAITPRARKSAIAEIAGRGVELRQLRTTDLYVLYEKVN